MNKSVLIIMGAALIVAMMVALMVQKKLAPQNEGTPALPTVEVLVASQKLLIGEKVDAARVRWQAWPEAALYEGVIRRSAGKEIEDLDVYQSPLRRNIAAGEPVTRQALVPDTKGGTNFLAALLDPGMRAMSVSVKPNTMAGGFITPGDHVDVILSYTPRLPRATQEYADKYVSRYASQTVLSNVKVLAVDQSAKEENREAKVAKTVTLEVSQEGAQILALAESMGDITLALRRIGDRDDAKSQVVPLTTDVTTSDVIKKLNNIAKESKASSQAIRMYGGPSIINVPVRAAPEELAAEAGE
jgi:pilus assembly protein CpaB